MYGPRLAGQHVTLAPPTPEHADDYARWFADPAVTRFLNLRNPPSRDQHETFLRAQGLAADAVLWSILVDNRHIGNTIIKDIDWRNRHGGTGLVIGESACWGRGYASEAMRLRTAYAFRELGLEKLMATAYGPNEASRRALQRAGYREVGWLRRHVYLEGAFIDVWFGEVLREEWAQVQEPRDRTMADEQESFQTGIDQNTQKQQAIATTVMNVAGVTGSVTIATIWEQGMPHISTLVHFVGAGGKGVIVHPLNDFDGTDPEALKEENRRIVRLIQKEGLRGVNMTSPLFGA